MDGAGYLSQCPILPHQDFTYLWRAEHSGTFWYHSLGVFGIFKLITLFVSFFEKF